MLLDSLYLSFGFLHLGQVVYHDSVLFSFPMGQVHLYMYSIFPPKKIFPLVMRGQSLNIKIIKLGGNIPLMEGCGQAYIDRIYLPKSR